jgi:hypothetical protein
MLPRAQGHSVVSVTVVSTKFFIASMTIVSTKFFFVSVLLDKKFGVAATHNLRRVATIDLLQRIQRFC